MQARSSSGRLSAPAIVPRQFPSPFSDTKAEAVFTGIEGLESQIDAWRALAERALAPDVIAEPDVMLPGLRHRAAARALPVLTIRQGDALRLVMPLLTPRVPVGAAPPRPWRAVPGTPGILVDRERADHWLRMAFDLLAERGPRFGALLLRDVPREGALADAIALATARSGRRLQAQEAAPGPAALPEADESGLEVLRTRRIALRRTEGVILDRVREPRLVRAALEEFLALDSLWAHAEKRHGLIDDVGEASFLRTATRQLAQRQRCRIDVLRIGGRAVAAAIVARSGETGRVIGVAADPALAHLDLKDAVLFEAWRGQGGKGALDLSALPVRVPSPALTALSRTPARLDLRVALQDAATPQSLAYAVRERVVRGLRAVTRRATPARVN